jgi:selenocysteine lyase/cysteine desulfurase
MDVDKEIVKLRDEFPILKYKTYLNSAAHGPALRRVHDAVQDWWRFRMCEDGSPRMPEPKAEAARLIGADPDEVCWVTRVSQGLNTVASMSKLKKGENVVVTDLAYPSNVFVWLPYKAKGVEIRRIAHHDGRIELSDFEKAVDDRTRVVCISRVEWTSGLKYDMDAISEVAHDHGAVVVDDAYQAVGPTEVDVHADGVDFLTFGSEKWLCCPTMAGVLYVKRGLIDEYDPSYRFYMTVDDIAKIKQPWLYADHDNLTSYEKPLLRTAEKFDSGCVSEEALWGFNACLGFWNGLDRGQVERRVKRLSGYLIDRLRNLGVKVNTPLEPEKRAGLVTYTTGRYEVNQRSVSALASAGIIVAHRYAGGVGGVRVSTNVFNTEEEIDRLLEVQGKQLK